MNTKDFELYQNGKNYNTSLDPPYYDMVDTNWSMFTGNQWINSDTKSELPKPVFNVINKIISFFIASLTSSAVKVEFTQLVGDDAEQDMEILNQLFKQWWDKNKMDFKVRDMYLDGAVTGDFAMHFYIDKDKKPYDGAFSKPFDVENEEGDTETIEPIGEICAEIVDGVNIYFGNPNNREKESQPYILVAGRDIVKNLKEEANAEILGDNDTNEQAGDFGKIEIEGEDSEKATYVYKYSKKKNQVKVNKSTKDAEIIKDKELGLKYYPVAFGNWENQKNTYHGRALVTSIVPNQIFINRMMAMAMYNLQMTAFPKLIYSSNISSWSNQIGTAIKVDMQPGDSVNNMAGYLSPGQMSSQIVQIIQMAMDFTKDMVGANNALLGSVNPEQASGASITVAARQSAVPLENPKNAMYSFLEDVANIFLDMVSNLYGTRPVVVEIDGVKQVVEYDFGRLKNIQTSVTVDVGPTSYYNEIARVQTLDNWLANGYLEFIDYLEELPDGFMPGTDALIQKLKDKMAQAQPDMNEIISQMSPDMQAQFKALPPEQQQAFLQEFMSGQAS